MSNSDMQRLSSTYPYKNPWFSVREDVAESSGEQTTFYMVECPESVCIIPLTSARKIVLVQLFRYKTQHIGWEVPAGGVEEHEAALSAAKRELQEETGLLADVWQELKPSVDCMNGISNATGKIYIATKLKESDFNMQQQEGIAAVRAFSLVDIKAMIKGGEVVDVMTLAALMKFLSHEPTLSRNLE